MADWTQIYQNPQTQALFGGAVPPIPSPSVQPIGGWGNVDLTQSMMNAPQQPQRPQMPVQTPQAPQAGQDGAMGIGQLIMMMLPMLLAGGTKHPNNARSAYMMGLMQQMNQQKALQQQKMAQQQAHMMEEQKRKYALANDLFKALTQNNPEAMYDGNLIGFMQTGDFEGMRNYINENRESLMPTKEPEKVDPWADKKVVGGHVASFDAEGNPVWISPPEKPKEPEKVDKPKYTGKFTDEKGNMWVYDPQNPDDRKLLGKVPPKSKFDVMTYLMLQQTDEIAAQKYLEGFMASGNEPEPVPEPEPSGGETLTQEQYEYLKANGKSDEEIIAEGYAIP